MFVTRAPEHNPQHLIASFQERKRPKRFFTVGKVFRVLWSEPAGESSTDVSGPSYTRIRFDEVVHSKVRRFVVVREGGAYCIALPITSYGGRGVSKPGVNKSEHGMVYTGRSVPELLRGEIPRRNEQPMQPVPVRVNIDDPRDKLDGASRIDYGKTYTVQHNIKVQSVGQVHQHSMGPLVLQFQSVWQGSNSPTFERIIARPSTLGAESVANGSITSGTHTSPPSQQSDALVAPVPLSESFEAEQRSCFQIVKSKILYFREQGYTAQQVLDSLLKEADDDNRNMGETKEYCSKVPPEPP